MTAWFPDVLAELYDAFAPHRHDPVVAHWRQRRPPLVEAWVGELTADPHGTAARIRDQIAAETDPAQRLERTFQALQASSDAISIAGISPVGIYGGPGWTEIRRHWQAHGNLARGAVGFVLPRRGRRYAWQGTRPQSKRYNDASLFGSGFIRAHAPADLAISIATVPDRHVPVETLDEGLRIAVAPLVHSMDELRFERIDEDNGRRAFRVTLTDPGIVANRATAAVEEAGRRGCDIVLFPELCLTPDGQQRLRAATAAAARSWGRPWLVVAGSSHTPAADGFHNRALVIDADGRECLTHNKLFAYQISTREQSRYAIGDALKSEPRDEDIIVVPRRLQLLECVLGRAAVLICEDLSNVLGTFAPILDRFEIDWLLVPVMDGVQTDARWPANYAMIVANEYGTNVIVATCGALVSAHRADLRQNGQVDPGHACGLLVQRGAWEANAVPLAAVDEGDNLVISFISGIRGRA